MSFLDKLPSVGTGYAVAIALGFLVLLAYGLLASYCCLRRGAGGEGFGLGASARHAASSAASSSGHISITVPRVVFVADDDESPGSSASPVGLDPAVIASYPRVPFAAGADAEASCTICLSEYRDGEMLRVMPECRHRFHLACLDAWLRRSASCLPRLPVLAHPHTRLHPTVGARPAVALRCRPSPDQGCKWDG